VTAALRTKELGHRYGRSVWGLSRCSIEVPDGRVVALVGPNGSGKTTLLNLGAGLLSPTTGTVQVGGVPPETRLDRIGYVAQDAPLWPRLRVADVIEIGRCLNPRFDTPMAEGRIHQLGIPKRARINTLSGGQRAQVALTLVIAKRPDLMLLDEPLANLDPLARREFLATMFASCAEAGTAVLFSSHVVAELERICDYLVVLRDGRVRLSGDIDELRRTHQVITAPTGWRATEGQRVISERSLGGRITALVRSDSSALPIPGVEESVPTFDELVLGYLDVHEVAHEEALA
jgi:ABC-2 type transport system ATP-binding protein